MKVKILGHGDVVKGLLPELEEGFRGIRFEIYCRKPPKPPKTSNPAPHLDFIPADRFVSAPGDFSIIACSVDEEAVLQESRKNLGRIEVAKKNLKLVSVLIEQNRFSGGTCFVLTNPSELVAELIAKECPNTSVFALGLCADFDRYREMFQALQLPTDCLNDFSLAGNHWDCPVPVFNDGSHLSVELHRRMGLHGPKDGMFDDDFLPALHRSLKERIRSEFKGFKPPVRSGVKCALDLLEAFRQGRRILVSGRNPHLKMFVGGVLDTDSMGFTPTLSRDGKTEAFLNQVFARHRIARDQLLEKT